MIKQKKDSGFTLIELMIVIAVIGILAVVMVPKVGSIKTSAKSAGVDVNVRAVQSFVESRIDYWATNGTLQWVTGTPETGIQPEIEAAFTTNTITNPISLGKDVVASSDGTLAPAGTADDALQVGGALKSTTLPKGGVIVQSTGTGADISIIITGYDANGSKTSDVTITP